MQKDTESRREFLRAVAAPAVVFSAGCAGRQKRKGDAAPEETGLFTARDFTAEGGFTSGIEGPACDRSGNLYAVNYSRAQTIGKVTPEGVCSVLLTLPGRSTGNGIRFHSNGDMLIADYVNHNVLRVTMETLQATVFSHEPRMNQPNDLAITAGDTLFASDPNWKESTGQLWRIDPSGRATLLEKNMGTTNGIEVSPDERTLYVNESVQGNVWAYDLQSDGSIRNKRLLVRFPDFGMDGMRCDAEGNLFITRYDKGTVVRLSPRGESLQEVRLKGMKPSNIAFGGPDGKTCYVTLADRGNIEFFRTDVPGRSWALLRERV